jgi:PhnB protein
MNSTQLAPYLSFSGNCRQAMEFYQSCLGGNLQVQTFAGAPMDIPADMEHQVLHSMLTSDYLTLMASDMADVREPLKVGNNVSLCLNCSSDEEITRLFSQLSDGGSVVDPLADAFWGAKFGALTDRFGTRWLLNYETANGQQH